MSTRASIKPQSKSALSASVRTIITKSRSNNKLVANAGTVATKGVTAVKASAGRVVPIKKLSSTTAEEFKSGDMIVYPGHGVGKIVDLTVSKIAGVEHKFFEIAFGEESSSKGMKVKVPVAQANSVGLRKVADKKTVEEVYAILKDRNFKIDTQTWNRRFREYSQKIKTGSVFEIAEVLRDLSVLGTDKELSFGEKRMLDTAQALLASEIAVAKGRSQEKIISEIQALFV